MKLIKWIVKLFGYELKPINETGIKPVLKFNTRIDTSGNIRYRYGIKRYVFSEREFAKFIILINDLKEKGKI